MIESFVVVVEATCECGHVMRLSESSDNRICRGCDRNYQVQADIQVVEVAR